MQLYRCELTLWEHTYFASRELGELYETEPVIGNYALTYALGLARSPYACGGAPRYRQELEPLNVAGVYVTPAQLDEQRLHFTISRFNTQAEGYFSAYTNNAIVQPPSGWRAEHRKQSWVLANPETGEERQVRANNFPQAGRIRALNLGCTGRFFMLVDDNKPQSLALLAQHGMSKQGKCYIRLGKHNSKAEVRWERAALRESTEQDIEVTVTLNAADLPDEARIVPLATRYIHPAPLLERCLYTGRCWRSERGVVLPAGMRYGVEDLSQ
jgi:CRISPR-associated protein Csc1